jgi:hypothetical protein
VLTPTQNYLDVLTGQFNLSRVMQNVADLSEIILLVLIAQGEMA